MSTSEIYFYSDNSANTLEIIPNNCKIEGITGPTGKTYIDEEPLYDSSGNLIYNNNSNGPGNPYNDYPYNSNSYYKTKYTISGINDNSSKVEITNSNGFYYIDLNNWIEDSNNGSTITFSYSTNPTLSFINSTEVSIRKGLYDITSFLDIGLKNISNTIKGLI